MKTIAINGFGRIGKLLARKILQDNQLKLASINHYSMTMDDLRYVISNDSVHGRFKLEDDIKIHNCNSPSEIPWESEVDIIIDTTGKFKEYDDVVPHVKNSNAKVIVSAPSKTLPMYIYGANHNEYKGEQFISASSCTTTCLAPVAKILNDNYTITKGLATTIHSVTASQSTVDKNKKNSRSYRSALTNIIPSNTGAAKSIGKIIPELDGKLNAIGVRVPVPNVSLLDLTIELKENPNLEDIISQFNNDSKDSYKDIIEVSDDYLVSSDFIGNPHNSIIDVKSCLQLDNLYKISMWYDNEYGYASSLLRLAKYIS